ncbi:MAG: hypothetical protein ABSA33_05950, partial [Candidatus Micrarchaeaceae archaeon]
IVELDPQSISDISILCKVDVDQLTGIEIEENPSKDPEHVYKNYLKDETLGRITFVVTMEEHVEIIRRILTSQHDIPENTPEHEGKYEIRYIKFQSLNDKPESTLLEQAIIYEKAQMFRAKGYAENAIFAILAGRSSLDSKEVRKILFKTIDDQKEINEKIRLLRKVGCSERMIKDFYGKLYSEDQIKTALDATANIPPATSLGEKVAAYKEMGYTGDEITTLLTPEYGLNEVKQAIGMTPQAADAVVPLQYSPAGLPQGAEQPVQNVRVSNEPPAAVEPTTLTVVQKDERPASSNEFFQIVDKETHGNGNAESTLQKPPKLQKAESPAPPEQPVEKKEALSSSGNSPAEETNGTPPQQVKPVVEEKMPTRDNAEQPAFATAKMAEEEERAQEDEQRERQLRM